jgi:bifunctional non-homologous end joining protein LigD
MADERLGNGDVSSTPEPGAGRGDAPPACQFVVQEHHARRLHWDFRLERDGVLVSWALPRGFPEGPGEDLPAAHTEDHPLDYFEFEGAIPAGSYAAGDVTVWDRGTYVCDAFEPDKVVVELRGERLRGRYALYRTRDDWRIHRMDAPDQGRDPMPERVVPMLARLGDLPADPQRYGMWTPG